MGQVKTPDPIAWVDAANEGTAVQDPGALKDSGWLPGIIPPATFANWFPNLAAKWINYFAGFLLKSTDSFVLSGLEVVPAAAVGFQATNVGVQFGEAVAGSVLVEVPSPANETVVMPATAGSASAGTVDAYLVAIDSTGTLTVNQYGTFASRDLALQQLPNLGVTSAALAVVFDEPTATVYDAAQIVDVRQLRPISGNVIADQSVETIRLTVPPMSPAVPPGLSGSVTQRYFDLDLNTFDPGTNWPLSSTKIGSIRLSVKAWLVQSSNLAPFDPPVGVSTLERLDDVPNSGTAESLAIAVTTSTGAVIQTLSGADAAIRQWSGDIDPAEGNPRVYLLRQAGNPSANTYRIEIGSEFGPPKQFTVTLPAT